MIQAFKHFIAGEMVRIAAAQESATGRFGRFECQLFVVATLCMVFIQFCGDWQFFNLLWGHWINDLNPYYELLQLLHWALCCVIGYMVIPMIFLKVWGHQLKEYYLSPQGFFNHPWGYIALMLPAFGIVYVVSFFPDFQRIYPFYTLAPRSWVDFIVWEIAYGLQFLALEFFFRAFFLEGLNKSLGYQGIWIMIVPYCMIHFEKTAAESIGSIFAGLLLGWMAMRSRSIWGGVLLHWFVAIEMDVMSMIQRVRWPPGMH